MQKKKENAADPQVKASVSFETMFWAYQAIESDLFFQAAQELCDAPFTSSEAKTLLPFINLLETYESRFGINAEQKKIKGQFIAKIQKLAAEER